MAVCHPRYLEDRPHPPTLADLADEPLLHTESEYPTWLSWRQWLEACGVTSDRKLSGPHFNSYAITLQAALDGRGIALGWRRLIDRYLQDGRLVQVSPEVLAPEDSYALVMSETAATTKAARAFRDWIVAQAERDWT
jgi:DNA-binding transcriptional LysR family regulator